MSGWEVQGKGTVSLRFPAREKILRLESEGQGELRPPASFLSGRFPDVCSAEGTVFSQMLN